MTTLSMAEVMSTASSLSTRKEKIDYLRKHNSKELRNVLLLMYDKKFELDLPDVAPPYNPSEFPDSHGLLYREARKLAYFVKGRPEGAKLTRVRKESLFIQMLEAVDKEDSQLLIRMIERNPFPELPSDLLVEAFGFTIVDPVDVVKKKRGRPRKQKEAVAE